MDALFWAKKKRKLLPSVMHRWKLDYKHCDKGMKSSRALHKSNKTKLKWKDGELIVPQELKCKNS